VYTATRDLMLPTTVTGSWPRPSWYTLGLAGRPLSSGMNDVAFREQFTDALDTVISDQERAGLDILTNGDYHQDPDLGGRSWVLYPVERLAGMSELDLSATDEWAYPPGTILNEVMGGWRYPSVEGELGVGVPLEYAKVWRLAQQRTDRPVKIGTVSAQVAVSCTPLQTEHYKGDKHQAMWDMATAFNTELRALAAAGCKVIQIEEPMLHLAATGGDRGEVEFLIEAFNHEISGLEDVEVWIHTCWGNPNMQKVTEDTSYEHAVELYMERAHGDVWTLEFKDNDPHATARLFDRYDGKLPKKVALGMVSHRTLQVESPDEVAADIRLALEHIDPEHLVLTSNCGFGRQGFNRLVAFYKSTSLAQGANIVRRELGVPETRVRAADPELQTDIPARASSLA
jgi:5-methyltetrahydropteroyltriglutamate--homocysteine methyltransferase